MNKKEAKDILGLPERFDSNDLKKRYNQQYISTFRKKSASMTMLDAQLLERQLNEFNSAYHVLDGSEDTEHGEFITNFNQDKLPDESNRALDQSELSRGIQDQLEKGQHLMVIQMLEIHIDKVLREELEVEVARFEEEIRLLGKCLCELGLINQGLEFYNYGLINYQKARNYRRIGDYRSAIHYFGKELKHPSGHFPIDEICQQISISYFLLGEYENAIHVIEEILPHMLPKKQIFQGGAQWKEFATELMVSMYKIGKMENKPLDKIITRVKYPISSKYLMKCHGTIGEAIKEIEAFEKDNDTYEDFLNSLKPASLVKEKISIEYSDNELRELYFRYFDDSVEQSSIYTPFQKKRS